MKRTTISTEWGFDKIELTADWSQASCPVEGDYAGRQVADFRHCAESALEDNLRHLAEMESMPEDEIEEAIAAAMSASDS